MPPRRAKQRAPARYRVGVAGPVRAVADGFYWYLPQPGDPRYDAWAPSGGAAVVHLASRGSGAVDIWFTGHPESAIMGTLGYLPEQFVGPLIPPSREGESDAV